MYIKERNVKSAMGNFINKIKQFFREIISKLTTKKLESPKEEILENTSNISGNQINKKEETQDLNYAEDKKEFFELYNKVKNDTIDLEQIDREDLIKIRKLLLEEAKIQTEKFADEVRVLKILSKVS